MIIVEQIPMYTWMPLLPFFAAMCVVSSEAKKVKQKWEVEFKIKVKISTSFVYKLLFNQPKKDTQISDKFAVVVKSEGKGHRKVTEGFHSEDLKSQNFAKCRN